jgi:hypothetical protein
MMAAEEPVTMEEAIGEGAAAFVIACAGMIITKIVTHFILLKSNKNGTKVWTCKTCNKEMTATGEIKLKHHVALREGGGISLCPNPNPEMQKLFAEELAKPSSKKRDSGPSSSSPKMSRDSIVGAFGKVGRTEADQAILSWLAAHSLSPCVVQGSLFKSVLRRAYEAGPTYIAPDRHSMGRVKDKLGSVLQEGLDRVRKTAAANMAPVKHIKVRALVHNLIRSVFFCFVVVYLYTNTHIIPTLCSDGARNIGRDALNSVLNSALGFFFVQSTNATGKTKDSEFLYNDLAAAVAKIGGAMYVFIICLDGPSVCKKLLRLVNERMPQIFGQRCTTHAWHLLLKDICKFEFMHVLSRVVRLLKFVVNHTAILVIFQELVVIFNLLAQLPVSLVPPPSPVPERSFTTCSHFSRARQF